MNSPHTSLPNTPERIVESQNVISNMRAVWSFEHLYPGLSRITRNFDAIETVLEAALRTRYKYAQYLIFRPYLYKVLHSGPSIAVTFPRQSDSKSQHGSHQPAHFPSPPPPPPPPGSMELPITTDDVIAALNAIKACTLWYLAHPVFRDQRRLLPHLYEYSHAIFGILSLFEAAERSPVLVTALEAAERGPSASGSSGIGFGAPPNPGGPSYPVTGSSSSQPPHSWQRVSTTTAGSRRSIELALHQMGVRGELEEFRYLKEAIGLSKNCFLGWMRDMQVVHPIARWCWGVCTRVYGVGEGGWR